MTILFYFLFEIDYQCLKKIQKGGTCKIDTKVNPIYLKRIPENIYTGFIPYDDNVIDTNVL